MKRYRIDWGVLGLFGAFAGFVFFGCSAGLGSDDGPVDNNNNNNVVVPPGCEDMDEDGQLAYDEALCSYGRDMCDDDPNNWTREGCSLCRDRDGDGYGAGCDQGADCNDDHPGVHADCGRLVWARGGGGAKLDSGFSVAALPDGSMAVTGVFEGSATFGAGEEHEVELVSAGQQDVFVAKYGPEGDLLWAKSAGSGGRECGLSVAGLSDGSVVVTGRFGGTAVFGRGEPNETSLTSALAMDIFVARYSPDGAIVWARRAGGTGGDQGKSVAAAPDGSVVVTGQFGGTAVFGPGEPNETTLHSTGTSDAFVARYDSDGILVWARRAGGADPADGRIIAARSDGSVVVSGEFENSIAFYAAGESQGELVSEGGRDVFIAKYGQNGNLIWARRAGGEGNVRVEGMVALADGSTLVAGDFHGAVVLGQGESNQTTLASADDTDIFLAKYGPNGDLIWARRAGGSDADFAYGLTALADGSVVITGSVFEDAIFGPGEENETELESIGRDDTFTARYAPDGNLMWARLAGGSGDDVGQAIAALSDGSVGVTGYFQRAATFGSDEPDQTVLNSAGNRDMYVARIIP